MKRISSLLLIILLLLTSCSKNHYNYPLRFTVKYCLNNYEPVDHNLVYLYSYDRKTSWFIPLATNYEFAAIKDVELNSFIAMVQYGVFWGTQYEISVVRKKGHTINPVQDWAVKKIELFWRNPDQLSLGYGVKSEDSSAKELQTQILQFAIYLFDELIKVIDDKEMMDEIINHAKNESIHKFHYNNGVNPSSINLDGRSLAIRIYFEECENLVWDALVCKGEDGYYIERLYYEPSYEIEDATWHYSDYYPLSDALNEMIDDLLNNN